MNTRSGGRRWLLPAAAAVVAVIGWLLLSAAGSAQALTVRPGQQVTVTAGGFAARTPVTVRVDGTAPDRSVLADEHGVAALVVRAPTVAGTVRVLFVGDPPGPAASASPTLDPGRNALVGVPLSVTVVLDVREVGPSGSSSPTGPASPSPSSSSGGAGAGGEGEHGGTSSTGVQVLGLITTVVVLVVVGVASVTVGRRRRFS